MRTNGASRYFRPSLANAEVPHQQLRRGGIYGGSDGSGFLLCAVCGQGRRCVGTRLVGPWSPRPRRVPPGHHEVGQPRAAGDAVEPQLPQRSVAVAAGHEAAQIGVGPAIRNPEFPDANGRLSSTFSTRDRSDSRRIECGSSNYKRPLHSGAPCGVPPPPRAVGSSCPRKERGNARSDIDSHRTPGVTARDCRVIGKSLEQQGRAVASEPIAPASVRYSDNCGYHSPMTPARSVSSGVM